MNCKSCGKELEEGAVICDTCGAPVEEGSITETAENIAETETEATTGEETVEAAEAEKPEAAEEPATEAVPEAAEEPAAEAVPEAAEEAAAEEPVTEAAGIPSEKTPEAKTAGEKAAETKTPEAKKAGKPVSAQDEKAKKKSKTIKIVVGVIIGVIVLAILLVIIIAVILISVYKANHPTINLNDYMTIEVTGYDGYATATPVFDYEAFEEDYGDFIEKKEDKLREKAASGSGDYTYYYLYGVDFYSNCISGYLDYSYDISNGDTITYTWSCSDVRAKDYSITLRYSDIVVEVSGLDELTTVDLSDYIAVDFEGYDTVGTAVCSFDVEKFDEQYGTTLEEDGMMETGFVYAYLDTSRNLTSGDIVHVYWSVNESVFRKYGILTEDGEMEVTVSGLEALAEVDPFDNDTLEVVFSGINGSGKAEVTYETAFEEYGGGYYSVSPSYSLTNGDTVTVTFHSSSWDLAEYGITYSSTEKDYEVSGLAYYVENLDDISEELLEDMETQAQDALKAHIAEWDDPSTAQNISLQGYYFLSAKSETNSTHNLLYLIYKVNVKTDKGSFSFYYYTQYKNIMNYEDGTSYADLTSYRTPATDYVSFRKDNLRYYGYEDVEVMYNKLVTAKLADYTYESTVPDAK